MLTWRQQADANAVSWTYDYDAADQLTAAIKRDTDPQATILKRYEYAYDPAGNRTAEQTDDLVMGATYNTVDELVTQQPVGAMVFAGSINEAANVTVAGTKAVVTPENHFRASVPVTADTNTIRIDAQDGSGNSTTQQYQLTNSGTSRTLSYDANGNLTNDGTRTFEWDARNQIVAVTVETHRSEFTYDGLQRRVREIEKENNVVQSDTRLLWCGTEICEERAANGFTVTRRAFRQGEEIGGVDQYFSLDHLASVYAVTDATGTAISRYAYDPWGRRTVVSGIDSTNVAFTSHRHSKTTDLDFALYRGYDPAFGRWISDDPTGIADGINRYSYVHDSPTMHVDLLGDRTCCSVEVKCRAVDQWVAKIAGAQHCYFVINDDRGPTTSHGGSTDDGKAAAWTDPDPRNSPTDKTWIKIEGNCNLGNCLRNATNDFTAMGFGYDPLGRKGPNSNSFVVWALKRCGYNLQILAPGAYGQNYGS